MTYSIWVTNNYDFLKQWSKRWSKNNWSELLSLYTIYLEKNWMRKMENIPQIERIKFTQTWFKNMVKWDNSEFNREIRVNNFEEECSMSDEEVDEFLEVTSETNRQDIKDWLVDLHRNFDELSCQRLINIRKIYLDLNTHEKVLYDLYFTQMLSLRDIGKKLNLPHMSVWSMVNDLKQKIKNEL